MLVPSPSSSPNSSVSVVYRQFNAPILKLLFYFKYFRPEKQDSHVRVQPHPSRQVKRKHTFPSFFRHSSAAEEIGAEKGSKGRSGDVWLLNAKSEGDDPDCISQEISQMVAERLVLTNFNSSTTAVKSSCVSAVKGSAIGTDVKPKTNKMKEQIKSS